MTALNFRVAVERGDAAFTANDRPSYLVPTSPPLLLEMLIHQSSSLGGGTGIPFSKRRSETSAALRPFRLVDCANDAQRESNDCDSESVAEEGKEVGESDWVAGIVWLAVEAVWVFGVVEL
jgi:hypothetical protein